MQDLKSKLLELITEYIECSSYLLGVLKKNYPLENYGILRSRKLNLIPKEGKVENIYFNFHGGGCYFELENDIIDVDFGPNDRTDGFDLVRLEQFLKMRELKYAEFTDKKDTLEKTFNQLISEHIIFNPSFLPNPHLYYLNSKL